MKSLPLCFKLFKCKDKRLRQTLTSHILNDVKRMNQNKKINSVNKQIQNFAFEILKLNSDNLAKKTLQIIVQLYKKHIWDDAKTVNIVSSGCFNEHYKVKLIACYFLIETTLPKSLDDDDEWSDDDVNESILVQADQLHGSKKNKAA